MYRPQLKYQLDELLKTLKELKIENTRAREDSVITKEDDVTDSDIYCTNMVVNNKHFGLLDIFKGPTQTLYSKNDLKNELKDYTPKAGDVISIGTKVYLIVKKSNSSRLRKLPWDDKLRKFVKEKETRLFQHEVNKVTRIISRKIIGNHLHMVSIGSVVAHRCAPTFPFTVVDFRQQFSEDKNEYIDYYALAGGFRMYKDLFITLCVIIGENEMKTCYYSGILCMIFFLICIMFCIVCMIILIFFVIMYIHNIGDGMVHTLLCPAELEYNYEKTLLRGHIPLELDCLKREDGSYCTLTQFDEDTGNCVIKETPGDDIDELEEVMYDNLLDAIFINRPTLQEERTQTSIKVARSKTQKNLDIGKKLFHNRLVDINHFIAGNLFRKQGGYEVIRELLKVKGQIDDYLEEINVPNEDIPMSVVDALGSNYRAKQNNVSTSNDPLNSLNNNENTNETNVNTNESNVSSNNNDTNINNNPTTSSTNNEDTNETNVNTSESKVTENTSNENANIDVYDKTKMVDILFDNRKVAPSAEEIIIRETLKQYQCNIQNIYWTLSDKDAKILLFWWKFYDVLAVDNMVEDILFNYGDYYAKQYEEWKSKDHLDVNALKVIRKFVFAMNVKLLFEIAAAIGRKPSPVITKVENVIQSNLFKNMTVEEALDFLVFRFANMRYVHTSIAKWQEHRRNRIERPTDMRDVFKNVKIQSYKDANNVVFECDKYKKYQIYIYSRLSQYNWNIDNISELGTDYIGLEYKCWCRDASIFDTNDELQELKRSLDKNSIKLTTAITNEINVLQNSDIYKKYIQTGELDQQLNIFKHIHNWCKYIFDIQLNLDLSPLANETMKTKELVKVLKYSNITLDLLETIQVIHWTHMYIKMYTGNRRNFSNLGTYIDQQIKNTFNSEQLSEGIMKMVALINARRKVARDYDANNNDNDNGDDVDNDNDDNDDNDKDNNDKGDKNKDKNDKKDDTNDPKDDTNDPKEDTNDPKEDTNDPKDDKNDDQTGDKNGDKTGDKNGDQTGDKNDDQTGDKSDDTNNGNKKDDQSTDMENNDLSKARNDCTNANNVITNANQPSASIESNVSYKTQSVTNNDNNVNTDNKDYDTDIFNEYTLSQNALKHCETGFYDCCTYDLEPLEMCSLIDWDDYEEDALIRQHVHHAQTKFEPKYDASEILTLNRNVLYRVIKCRDYCGELVRINAVGTATENEYVGGDAVDVSIERLSDPDLSRKVLDARCIGLSSTLYISLYRCDGEEMRITEGDHVYYDTENMSCEEHRLLSDVYPAPKDHYWVGDIKSIRMMKVQTRWQWRVVYEFNKFIGNEERTDHSPGFPPTVFDAGYSVIINVKHADWRPIFYVQDLACTGHVAKADVSRSYNEMVKDHFKNIRIGTHVYQCDKEYIVTQVTCNNITLKCNDEIENVITLGMRDIYNLMISNETKDLDFTSDTADITVINGTSFESNIITLPTNVNTSDNNTSSANDNNDSSIINNNQIGSNSITLPTNVNTSDNNTSSANVHVNTYSPIVDTFSLFSISPDTRSKLWGKSVHNRYGGWYDTTLYNTAYYEDLRKIQWNRLKMKIPTGNVLMQPLNAWNLQIYEPRLTPAQSVIIQSWVDLNNLKHFIKEIGPGSFGYVDTLLPVPVSMFHDWKSTEYTEEHINKIHWNTTQQNVPIHVINPAMRRYFSKKVNPTKNVFITDDYDYTGKDGPIEGHFVKIIKGGILSCRSYDYFGFPIQVKSSKNGKLYNVCTTSVVDHSCQSLCM